VPRRLLTRRCVFYLACLLLLGTVLVYLTPETDVEDPHAWIDEYLESPPEEPPATDEASRRSSHKWLRFWEDEEDESLPQSLDYAADGLVRGWDSVHAIVRRATLGKKDKRRMTELRDKHPIEVLMANGRERWETLLEK
jgi:hypothetical protein